MRFLGDNPFHTILLLTARPGSWPLALVALVPLGLAALAGWVWAQAGHAAAWGWATTGLLLLLALADVGLLAALPRTNSSYGPVQPPLLALSLLRFGLALLAALLAAGRPGLAWAVQAAVQVLMWGLAVQGTFWEPFRVQVTRLALAITRPENPAPGQHLVPTVVRTVPARRLQAGPARGLRIVQISDLHVERLTRRERALPALLDRLAPDLVVFTGDYMSTTYNDDPQALAELGSLLDRLRDRARYGTWAIWGTQEVDLAHLLRPILRQAGVTLLEDHCVEVVAGDQHLWILGLNCGRDLAADGDRLRQLMARVPPGELTLLLYHTPDLMPLAAELGVDLYLAGHTHGGQWRLPGFGAIVTASHYGKRYEAGHYREGKTNLYVSRGLGLEGFGTPRARIFCPPEVVVVDLEPPPVPGPAQRVPGTAGQGPG